MDIYVLVHRCLSKSNGAVNTTFLLLVSKRWRWWSFIAVVFQILMRSLLAHLSRNPSSAVCSAFGIGFTKRSA